MDIINYRVPFEYMPMDNLLDPNDESLNEGRSLTQRAPDGWESPRFQAVCWLKIGSGKAVLSPPAHPRVTLTVGLQFVCQRIEKKKNETYLRMFITMKNVFFYVLSLAVLAGCIMQPMAPSDFPYELMLQQSDLPTGFTRTGGSFPDVKDGYSHRVGFSSNPDEIGTGIGHQITIYPDVNSAQDHFSDWEKEWFTPAWHEPLEMFTPIDPNDKSRLACMDVQINDEPSGSCTYLQQHNNLIILVFGNINDKALSYDQFITMLGSLDSRLPEKDKLVPTPVEWHAEK